MQTKLLLLIFFGATGFLSAQIGFQENIAVGSSYNTPWPEKIKAADIDGDGDLDIVAYGRELNWYENVDGMGNFGQEKNIAALPNGGTGVTLHTADFDNDGDVDILCAKINQLTVHRNTDGFGNFAVMQVFTVGLTSTKLLAAPTDMDNDGDLDIVCFYTVANSPFQGKLVWFENNGNATFAAEQIITSSSSALSATSILHLADVDADGDDDIILGHSNFSKISWLKNSGSNGTFDAPIIVTTAAPAITSIITSDFDNDGDIDIVSAASGDNQVSWYSNTDGAGTFSGENVITSNATSSNSVWVGDINNDNTKDIVYTGTNEIGWISHNGSGGFGTEQVITNKAFNVKSVIMADLDGDGKDDLVSASFDDDKVAWYKALQGNVFGRQVVIGRLAEFADNVYPGDFDGDNDIDLLVSSQYDRKLSWVENVNGVGFFGKQHVITENHLPNQFLTPVAYPFDIDGDGDLDIATHQGTRLFWFENDGLGNFPIEHEIDNTSAASIIRAADLDGDGDLDLVCGVYSTNGITWYPNPGNGVFGPEQTIVESGNSGSLTSLELSDMDGDNDMDIMVSSFNSYTKFYKNDGLGNFAYQYFEVFDAMHAVYPADMDGDGDKDIIAVRASGDAWSSSVLWYENEDGQGTFLTSHTIYAPSTLGKAIHAADLDNDGDMDVLTAGGNGGTPGQLSWYENNGSGIFGDKQLIHEVYELMQSLSVRTADIDNDGDADVLSTFGYSGSWLIGKVSAFMNLGVVGNMISGQVLIDSNSNGCSIDDIKGRNIMVVSDNGSNTFATFTDLNGNYNVSTTEGDFTTAINLPIPDYFGTSPSSHIFSFEGMNNSQDADFCLTPAGAINDLEVSVYPSLNNLRPGFNTYYRIVYKNMGTTSLSGTVVLEYDNNKINFNLANQPVVSQTANALTFTYADLQPFETRTIDLQFTVFAPPVTNIDDQVLTTVTVNPLSDDTTQGNNNMVLNQTVIGSFDPNDITCLEGHQVLVEDAGNYLHYIIRFQNTGNASAINVNVENTLDSKLDWTSMQLESLSHSGRVEIIDGNNVKFIFNNIHLPASTTNELGSHGFIAYKIKPLDDVIVGDIINNTANIYFDFNPPIITNTAATEFVSALSIAAIQINDIKIYPNPVNSVINIDGPALIDKVEVIDIHGRILKEIEFDTPKMFAQADISDLASGIYILKINSAQQYTIKKILKQ